MAESNKSRYKPSHPEKYNGDPSNIICRSSWERKFCVWCDLNENVISWASEEIFINYYNPIKKRLCKYFPDFVIKLKEKNGEIKTYVIEVKPKKQTVKPKTPTRKTKSWLYEMKTYEENKAKWSAADEWCKDRKIEFKVITEDNLFN